MFDILNCAAVVINQSTTIPLIQDRVDKITIFGYKLAFITIQFLVNASQIGGHFLPLIMFLEAVKLQISHNQKGKIPQASRTSKLFLAYCYRYFLINKIQIYRFHYIPSKTVGGLKFKYTQGSWNKILSIYR